MRRALLLFLPLLFVTGCRATTHVDVTAHTDGSGVIVATVTLDREAAVAVPDLAEQLRTGDLEEAGWSVQEPDVTSDGGAVVEVSRSFENPAQLAPLMNQLSGPDGPFRDFRLEQTRSVTQSRTTFSGTVDLTRGIESFGDETLRARVGSRLGFDVNEASTSLGVNWQDVFPVEMEVHLPGGATSYEPAVDDDGVWNLQHGSVTRVQAEASGANFWPISFFALSGLSILGALLVAALWTTGIYRPQHRAKDGGVRARDLVHGDKEEQR